MRSGKKILSIFTVIALAAAMSACGTTSAGTRTETSSQESSAAVSEAAAQSSEAAAESSEAASEESAEEMEDGQNPVMNFIGPHACDRAQMDVSAKGSDEAEVTVSWAGSASTNATWVMSGKFDLDTLTMEYDNCTKTVREYDESGAVVSEETEYENGTGCVVFNEDNTITWEDDQENIAEGMVFEFSFTPPEE